MSKLKERRVWKYTCDKCGKSNRQANRKQKARDAICRTCRRIVSNPNQTKLFGSE